MSRDFVHVIAEVRLLSTEEGGKTAPIRGSYRPNHNFFDAPDREMTAGFIDLPKGVTIGPGETAIAPISLWWWPGLVGEIYVGREWRIQEGLRLVGYGRVIALLDEDGA